MNKFFGAAALAVSLAVAPAAAQAAVTFAQYEQVDGGLDTVVYDDGTLSDTGGVLGSLVSFNFLDTVGPGLDDPVDAYLNINSNGSPWGGTISFTRVSDGANLLTLTFSGAQLAGAGGSGALFGSTPGGTVSYTSDFIDFTNANVGDFALGFSGITPGMSANFWTGDSVGTFAADVKGRGTEVPEPATWAMMIIGFGGIGAVLRRRRTGLTFA